MAGTFTNDLTTITACENTSGFSGESGVFFGVTGPAPEGTNYLYHYRSGSASGQHYARYDNGSGINFTTSNDLFFVHGYFSRPEMSNKDAANEGAEIHLEDTSSNWKRWAVHGADCLIANDYVNGLYRMTVDPTATSDSNSGTLSVSALRYFEMRTYLASGFTGVRISIDHMAYGRGITCTGGTGVTLDDVTSYDSTNDLSLFRKIGNIFAVQCDLKFDSTASNITFTHEGDVYSWIENRGATDVERGIYGTYPPRLIIDESGANTTSVVFGNETSEVGGPSFIAEGGNPVIEIAAAITKAKFLGSLFSGVEWDFAAAANPIVKNCPLDNCGEFPLGTRTFEDNNVINATSGVLMGASHVSKNNRYIGCTDAIHVSDNGPLTLVLDGDMFSGNTDDIHFSGTGTLTVTNTNGADAASSRVSGGGTVVINEKVDVSFEAVDKADAAIENVRVTAYKVSDDTEIINALTNASGIASTTYTGTMPVDIYYRYRKSSTGATKYVNLSGFATISTVSGSAVKRSMTVDAKADPAI